MNAAAQAEDTLEASVATMFDVLSWEMELAGARCIFLDSVIGEMMKCLPDDKQAEFLESAHTVDLLSQQLTSLSAFARRMSATVASDVSAPVNHALGDMTLGALADRMSTAFGGKDRGINEREDAGDLDLF
jgi:hypothetical protein